MLLQFVVSGWTFWDLFLQYLALQEAACRAHRVACRAALRGVDLLRMASRQGHAVCSWTSSCQKEGFEASVMQEFKLCSSSALSPSLCLSANKGWSHEAFAVKGLKLSASLVHAFSVHCRFYVKDTQAHKPHKHTTYTFHCISKHIQRNKHYHKQGFWRKPDIIVEASNL